jgi:hypothetical protein
MFFLNILTFLKDINYSDVIAKSKLILTQHEGEKDNFINCASDRVTKSTARNIRNQSGNF